MEITMGSIKHKQIVNIQGNLTTFHQFWHILKNGERQGRQFLHTSAKTLTLERYRNA